MREARNDNITAARGGLSGVAIIYIYRERESIVDEVKRAEEKRIEGFVM